MDFRRDSRLILLAFISIPYFAATGFCQPCGELFPATYLIPLPLVGVRVLRIRRIRAAVSPTSSLSMPEMVRTCALFDRGLDPIWQINNYRVGISNIQFNHVSLDCDPVTNTNYFQALAEPFLSPLQCSLPKVCGANHAGHWFPCLYPWVKG